MFPLDDSPSFQMLELGTVDSTNNFLRHYRPLSPRRLVLATAEFQTAGRGAGNNTWESSEGQNLLFSLLTHPRFVAARDMFALSEVMSLAVCNALDEFLPGTQIKWPNDIYYGDRKIAGMLIENELEGKSVGKCVMGVGININQTRFESSAPNPVSLAQLLGHPVERRFVMEAVVKHFLRHYDRLEQESASQPPSREQSGLRALYMDRLYRRGQAHRYADANGAFLATLEDIAPAGHLLLRDAEGRLRRYAFKEVQFLI